MLLNLWLAFSGGNWLIVNELEHHRKQFENCHHVEAMFRLKESLFYQPDCHDCWHYCAGVKAEYLL